MGKRVPDWYATLEMATEWGLAPWEIEAEASAVWVDRWLLLRNLRVAKQERDAQRRDSGGGGRGRRLV